MGVTCRGSPDIPPERHEASKGPCAKRGEKGLKVGVTTIGGRVLDRWY